MTTFFSSVQTFMSGIEADRQRSLQASVLSGDGLIEQGGRRLVNMASNDYLGLASDPQIREAAARAAQDCGAGVGASRLVTGNHPLFVEVEEKLAALKGTETALLFNSGFQANAGLLAALLDGRLHGLRGRAPKVRLFTDRLNHASLHFGIAASGAVQKRFRHNDLDHLEELLEQSNPEEGPAIVVTESVFSMDGDRLDVGRIRRLAQQYDVFLMIDEAHASGVLGLNGMGLCAHDRSENYDSAELVMGTFGKALGSFGAYAACSDVMKQYLVNRCSGLIYSTGLPPAVLGAMSAALDRVPKMEAERAHLQGLSDRLRERLGMLGLDSLDSSTQIVPVVLGSDQRVMSVAKALKERGYLVGAIRPPTVPEGTGRLRITLSAAHSCEQVEGLLSGLKDILENGGPL
ncbi:aminotransferase class I/II-fold pyridoxal phosphate-dependent enzyme [Kiloniella sp. b19]|uniref:aminotransferase class I/II-fold pyridoxal phosphate-dependent enzyme n=1 Tax=Kiloniella sp. GXU_MW_B19 TaxID=3141326 RepID=UPI0031D58400